MTGLFELIQAHPATSLFVTEAALNTLVGAMEEPTEKNGPLYRYIYRLGHALSLNFQYAFTKKFPAYQPATPQTSSTPSTPPTPPAPPKA